MIATAKCCVSGFKDEERDPEPKNLALSKPKNMKQCVLLEVL